MKRRTVTIGLICLFLVTVSIIAAGRNANAQAAGPSQTPKNDPTVLQTHELHMPMVVRHTSNTGCDAIQNAIDALPETGGQILISSGTFTCTTAWQPTKPATVSFPGSIYTTIRTPVSLWIFDSTATLSAMQS